MKCVSVSLWVFERPIEDDDFGTSALNIVRLICMYVYPSIDSWIDR